MLWEQRAQAGRATRLVATCASLHADAPAPTHAARLPVPAPQVLPVTSGYRLTFSYNLYSAAAPPAPSAGNKRARSAPRALPLVSAAVAAERPPVPALDGEREAPQVVAALRGLLADPGWHTGGATLGCVLGYK